MKAGCTRGAMTDQKTVYIAGPMTGYKDFNFPAFDNAAEYLRDINLRVISPADHDRAMGINAATPPSAEQLKSAIMWDLEQVSNVDIVFFLIGWENSKGARAEHALAVFLGKGLMYE